MIIFLDQINGTGDWLGEILTWIVEQLEAALSYILELLPRSPFADIQYSIPDKFDTFMHLFFWVFPAKEICMTYAGLISIFLVYYALRVGMNWVKMIGS